MASDLDRIAKQQAEILHLAESGALDAGQLSKTLERIIAGDLPLEQSWVEPSWWRAAELQRERVRQLWPKITPPEPPKKFVPRTESEVLLLVVSKSLEDLWEGVIVPDGYAKLRPRFSESDTRSLQLIPSSKKFRKATWVAFDPEYGRGKSPESLWTQPQRGIHLAGDEILSALIQFPEWMFAWQKGASAPNLSGYQVSYQGDDSQLHVPCLTRLDPPLWGGTRRHGTLKLDDRLASESRDHWASPSVRLL